MDIKELHIGRPIRIRTEDDIYDSYISAITLTDENFVYFKSGTLRNTLIDKLKQNEKNVGDKLDTLGGTIKGDLTILGEISNEAFEEFGNMAITSGLKEGRLPVLNHIELNTLEAFSGFRYCLGCTVNGETIENGYFLQLIYTETTYRTQIHIGATNGNLQYRKMVGGTWQDFIATETRITEGQEESTNQFVDNKRVYVKRIDCGNLPNSATKTIAHGLSNVKIEHFDGIMRANTMQTYSLPHVDTIATNSVRVQLNSSVISIATARDWSNMTATIDIYYTKN